MLIIFVDFQNPREADAMTKINADLDETKIILVSWLVYVPHASVVSLATNTIIETFHYYYYWNRRKDILSVAV